jgi:hypothetical protein
MRIKENPGLKFFANLNPVCLDAGLMKPRRGSTPGPGKETLGNKGKIRKDLSSSGMYHRDPRHFEVDKAVEIC